MSSGLSWTRRFFRAGILAPVYYAISRFIRCKLSIILILPLISQQKHLHMNVSQTETSSHKHSNLRSGSDSESVLSSPSIEAQVCTTDTCGRAGTPADGGFGRGQSRTRRRPTRRSEVPDSRGRVGGTGEGESTAARRAGEGRRGAGEEQASRRCEVGRRVSISCSVGLLPVEMGGGGGQWATWASAQLISAPDGPYFGLDYLGFTRAHFEQFVFLLFSQLIIAFRCLIGWVFFLQQDKNLVFLTFFPTVNYQRKFFSKKFIKGSFSQQKISMEVFLKKIIEGSFFFTFGD